MREKSIFNVASVPSKSKTMARSASPFVAKQTLSHGFRMAVTIQWTVPCQVKKNPGRADAQSGGEAWHGITARD
jgi:hypothetical protein